MTFLTLAKNRAEVALYKVPIGRYTSQMSKCGKTDSQDPNTKENSRWQRKNNFTEAFYLQINPTERVEKLVVFTEENNRLAAWPGNRISYSQLAVNYVTIFLRGVAVK